MDYRSQIASYQQHVQKDMDYSQIMVAELESGWSISYQQQESYFVADKWFPQIGVDKIAGYYPKWAKENAFTNKAGTWRPGTLPPTARAWTSFPITGGLTASAAAPSTVRGRRIGCKAAPEFLIGKERRPRARWAFESQCSGRRAPGSTPAKAR